MEHVVFYQSAQGAPAFRRVSSIEDAVSFAEHLRNVEGVTDFSVYGLSPVTLSLRAYYHVEVAGEGASPATAAIATPRTEEPAPASPAASAEPAEPPAPTATSSQPDYVAESPFASAPLVGAAPEAQEQARAEGPTEGEPLPEAASDARPIDPSVVDPTVEEVVPNGRRSMGFFARP